MQIFVCIKQVPATNKVQVDEKTGVLKRSGVAGKMNPYDLYALETALRLKEAHGGTVTVGTMGPPQAQAVVREAYMMGADEGYVFSDRRLGGADVLATGYTLSQAIRSVGDFDLILCGRQTTDGDTAQVGPAIAEYLGIPHAAWVSRLTLRGDGVDAEQQLQDTVETVHMPFPCLVTVEQDIYVPRLPSLKIAREIADKPVHMLGLDAFPDQDESHYGLTGSATQVERIFPPENEVQHEIWEGGDSADRLFSLLKAQKYV
ncbi:MAG: electron transfer flavoprotein subunit beta/FixA family protein [Clostridia bacterium]|nr:electron transfer flavoprotein subunit beta/FixA family protein [Clostridia bacterium]MBR4442345.1 electron transfer flavoprotein subunit beta/FixA family protein [Clostridia bacterium]